MPYLREREMATPAPDRQETSRATLWGALVAGLVFIGIQLGSRGLEDFDTALVPYAGATVFAAFGLAYRYVMWLQRPPTRLYWFRGWQIIIEVALALLVLQAIAINRLAGLEYPLWRPRAR
jgi:hypothetical protein